MQEYKNDNAARRLLNRLKSPFLSIASDSCPQSPRSLVSRRIGREIENLFGGRFSLANNQNFNTNDEELLRYSKLRIYDHRCEKYFWMSIAQLQALGPDRACCHCADPVSLDQIGGKIEIQQYVLRRSLNNVYFGNRNLIGDMTDIYDFICIRCKCTTYEAPFVWFLRDSPGTNACPCCEQRMKEKKI